MTLQLTFGLQPPPEAIRAWGARAIYETHAGHHRFSLVHDRQACAPEDDADDAFEAFMTSGQELLRWLDGYIRDNEPGPRSELLMVHSAPRDGGTLVLEATPQRSYGYVYMVIYELAAGVQPRHADTPTARRARA